MPDVGGHVISREFSRDVQLYNTHAVCDFTARAWIMLHSPHGIFCINSSVIFLLKIVFSVNSKKRNLVIMNECCLIESK